MLLIKCLLYILFYNAILFKISIINFRVLPVICIKDVSENCQQEQETRL